MVKIAIAGGAGNVAQEIIEVLLSTGKHDVLIFTRRDVPTETPNRVTYAKTNYQDPEELAKHLQGTEVVLSFISPHLDQAEAILCQKNLIDASLTAGVKRFAPSEWATSKKLDSMDWYAYKAAARDYLSEINKDKKVLEYSLFQPGLFTNYLTNPYPTAKYLTQFQCQLDFEKKRAILLEGSDEDVIVLTTVQDMAHVVARAVEYEGEWPVDGGMRGSRMTLKEIIALGEEIRGGPFAVERIPKDEMVKGTWNSSWLPAVNHPSIPLEYREAAAKGIIGGIMLAINNGAFDINGGWNKLLPDYKFTDAKEFLSREWEGKP